MEETRNAFTCSYGEKDRISRLPDNLIHHIMSFNDTKYAVRTSLLSKRWIHVWKSLPILNFCRSSFSRRNTERFIEFVYSVCIFRYDTNIQKFNVQWGNPESCIEDKVIMNVNRWILFAVKRDVQEISIRIQLLRKWVYEIPHLLLNCKSLRALDIIILQEAGADTILPTSMNLPQLKVLRIRGLSFSNVELSAKLLSSCPILESLHIFHCDMPMDNHGNLIVASVTLKEFEYIWWLDTTPNIIRLCAPNLEKLTCSSFITLGYHLENCSSLSWVHFDMFLDEDVEKAEKYSKLPSTEKHVYAKRMMKLLGAASTVKQMELSAGFLELLSQAPDLLDCQPPRLCNMEHLVLDMWSTRGCLQGIAYLLKISPNLSYLSLRCNMESNSENVDDDWETGLSSRGILSHLKHVQIERVEGCDAELKLLSFLLKNATDLEELSVDFLSRGTQVGKFKDKLRGVPTASSSIRLLFKT